ncbi:hypothetical protein ABPG72_007119 [Tetrahymena utriculariae]
MQSGSQNLQSRDISQDKYAVTCRIEKFIICVDPDSRQIYGLNPQNNDLYIFLDEKLKNQIDYDGDRVQVEEMQNVKFLNQLREEFLEENKIELSSQIPKNQNNINHPTDVNKQNGQQSPLPIQQNGQQPNQNQEQVLNMAVNAVDNAILGVSEIKKKYTIDDYRIKGKKAIENIEKIIQINDGNWLINHERADQYRRRKLPNYLLQRTDQNHPTYICQSPLSEVFVNVVVVTIKVNLINFKSQLYEKQMLINKQNQANKQPLGDQYSVTIKVELVTAADEVLKKTLRQIYKIYNTKLQPQDNKTFILKIEGYREYLSGHYPMLSYDRVRTNLRIKKSLKVILDQKQNAVQNQKLFPPEFERLVITINFNKSDNKHQRFNKQEKTIEEIQNLLKLVQNDILFKQGGKIKQLYLSNNYKIIDNTNQIIFQDQFNINWEDYQQIPVLLWYAPQKLPRYVPQQNINDLIQSQQENLQKLKQSKEVFNEHKRKYLKLYKQTNGFLFTTQQDRYFSMYDQQTLEKSNYSSIHSTIQDTNTQQDDLLRYSTKLSQEYNGGKENHMILNEHEEEEDEYIDEDQVIEEGKKYLQQTYQDFYQLKKVQCEIDPNRFLKGCQQAEKFAKQFLGEGQQNDLLLRVIKKERMKELIEKRRNLSQQSIFSEIPTNLYSGECDWIFKVKIKGIENLYRIFEQANVKDDNYRATYNGILPPVYITKFGEWLKAKEHEEKIAIPQRIDGNPKPALRLSKVIPQRKDERFSAHHKEEHSAVPVSQNDISRRQNQIQDSYQHSQMSESGQSQSFFKFATDHGDKGCSYFQQLQQKFDINFAPYLIQVQVKLMYGNRALAVKKETQKIPFSRSPRWDEWIKFSLIKISQLPLESRICFDIIVYSVTGLESQIIGSTNFYIFDQFCKFTSGISPLNIWPFYASDDRLACAGQYYGLTQPLSEQNKRDQRDHNKWEEFKAREYSRLFIELDTFQKHMFWSLRDDKTMIQLGFQNAKNRLEDLWVYTPQNQYLAELKELLKRDPINRNFDMRQKLILLICRNHFKSIHQALDIFLCAVDWSNPEHIRETYNLLKQWKSPPSEECITFLDAHHADEVIRLYGVERISKMADDEIKLYMIELVQALMFENNHYSPIQELLLERSLLNPFVVGHELFWSLKSQLHLKQSYERYALVLEQLLMLSGEYRSELLKEVEVNNELKNIARKIKVQKSNEQAKEVLEKELKRLINNKYKQKGEGQEFTLAIDNRLQLNDFDTKKCKFMNSKKKPLWLVMKNAENQKEFSIMFKDGDDLRQDILTLQLIRIMDKIWLDNNLDLRMKPYNVVATLDQVGMLEIVQNSQTTAAIHKQNNQRFGCLMKESIQMYLKKHNQKNYDTARGNFRTSCAGYCVATYILGIGDRHSDNIMITKEGHFFHIDFGHFLGNFKKKFGINRERSPFVFTRVMEYVMLEEEEDYKAFERYCCQAYNLIRKHGNFFINIFRMMLSAGMPELQRESDIEYLVETLQLNLSDQEAEQHFKKQIRIAREDKFKLFDNFIHEIVKK